MESWGKRKDGQAYRKDKPKGMSGTGQKTSPTSDVHLKEHETIQKPKHGLMISELVNKDEPAGYGKVRHGYHSDRDEMYHTWIQLDGKHPIGEMPLDEHHDGERNRFYFNGDNNAWKQYKKGHKMIDDLVNNFAEIGTHIEVEAKLRSIGVNNETARLAILESLEWGTVAVNEINPRIIMVDKQ